MRKSFKKGIAMLLVAAMVFGTPLAAGSTAKAATEPTVVTGNTTEEDVVSSGGFNVNFSNYYKATGNFEAVFKLHMDETGAGNYNTQYFVISPDADREEGKWPQDNPVCIRADQWAFAKAYVVLTKDWFTADAEANIEAVGPGDKTDVIDDKGEVTDAAIWQNWREIIAGSDMEVTVKRVGDNFKVTEIIEKDSKNYSMVYDVTYADAPDAVRMWFGSDGSKFTIKSYTCEAIAGVADALLGDVSAALDDTEDKVNVSYDKKLALDDLSVAVNGASVSGSAITGLDVTGSAVYAYPVTEAGTYTFDLTAKKNPDEKIYFDQKKSASITLAKYQDKIYAVDNSLITTDLSVEEKTAAYDLNWAVAEGAEASAVVTGPDGNVVTTLTAPGTVKVSKAGDYTVALTVTKGRNIQTANSGFSYVAAPADTKEDKFSKITTKPLYKYTFDSADSVKAAGLTLSEKAAVKDGVLQLAPSADKAGEYYAKLPSMTTKDFSKGITFVADVNVAAYKTDWSAIVIFGDGAPATDAATASWRWAFSQGFSSKCGTSADFHAGSGFYGATNVADYPWDFFSNPANQNKWYTVAVTVSPTKMTTYMNGNVMQTADGDYSDIITGMKKASNNYLGASYWKSDVDLAGSMDDVAIYDSALSDTDIKALVRTDAAPPTSTGGTGATNGGAGGTKKTMMINNISAKAGAKKVTGSVNAPNATVQIKVGKADYKTATMNGKKFTLKTSKLKLGTKITVKASATDYITATKSLTVKGTMKLSAVKAKKNSKKITGKLSVKKATVKVKVGKKKYKKAKVKGKKFTFKCAKLKKGTKVKIKVTKKNYKTLNKTVKVK